MRRGGIKEGLTHRTSARGFKKYLIAHLIEQERLDKEGGKKTGKRSRGKKTQGNSMEKSVKRKKTG